jgi:hypothetical protein
VYVPFGGFLVWCIAAGVALGRTDTAAAAEGSAMRLSPAKPARIAT